MGRMVFSIGLSSPDEMSWERARPAFARSLGYVESRA